MSSSHTDPIRRSALQRKIPRRGLLSLLAAAPAAVVTACSNKSEPRPGPTTGRASRAASSSAASPSPSSTRSVSVTTKGVTGDLARLAQALYGGKEVSTSAAAAALKDRKPPTASALTVTGSQGQWHGTPIGILSQGKDLTFAVQRDDTWTVVAGKWPGLGVDKLCAGGRQFVLLIGSDAREAKGESITRSRGDTLHIVGVDGSGNAGIVGIPRDSWTGADKINSALAYGGPTGQVDAVKKLTGLPVQHYVLTGFNGFRSFVDALGGVTVDNPRALPSRHIPKGRTHLDSKAALWFARERHDLPDGDFGRSANQQRLLVAFALTMKSLGPARFGSLVSKLSTLTKSNLPAEAALQYAAWAWSMKTSKLVRVVATGGFGTRGGQSVVLLGSSAEAIFKDFADGDLSKS